MQLFHVAALVLHIFSINVVVSFDIAGLPTQFPLEIPWNIDVIKSEKCKNDLNFWNESLSTFFSSVRANCTGNAECEEEQRKNITNGMFAIQQIDSFGKIPANLLGMNTLWQGSWDECINVESGSNYQGGFCWIKFAPNLPFLNITGMTGCKGQTQIKWSVCMPRSCSSEDITALFATLNNQEVQIEFCSAECLPATAPSKNTWFWVVTGYCLLVGVLIIVSTIVDYVTEKSDKHSYERFRSNKAIAILLTFSVYTNGAEILSTKKAPGQIHCLNCIRAVSMTWVMTGHGFFSYVAGDNPLGVMNARKYFLNQAFMNAFPSVDSFLFIGGVLLGFLFFKAMHRNRRNLKSAVYWILYYVHRYFRLSAPYFFFLGFYAVMYPYMSRGPQQSQAIDIEDCKKHFWRNILYINNYFSDMCMVHTWYLATDMQIYFFAPILLVPLFLSPIAGGIVAILLFILTIASTYATFYKYNFPGAILLKTDGDMTKYMKLVYGAPWVRYTPNLFGILTGYIIYRFNEKKLKIHWAIVVLLWLASAALGIGTIYSLYDAYRGKTEFGKMENASYYTFHRVGWSLALAWVVIACHFNLAGFIKNFMEHGFWMPLGRLTYCAYLVHFMVIYVIFGQERTPLHFSNMTEAYIHGAIPIFVVSFAFAFAWSCGFEIPFGKLEKMATVALVGRTLREEQKKSQDKVVQNGSTKPTLYSVNQSSYQPSAGGWIANVEPTSGYSWNSESVGPAYSSTVYPNYINNYRDNLGLNTSQSQIINRHGKTQLYRPPEYDSRWLEEDRSKH